MKTFNKFKVGDWIAHNNGYRGPYLITSINEYGYELDGSMLRILNVDNYHKVKNDTLRRKRTVQISERE